MVVSDPPAIISAPSSQTNNAGTAAVFSVGASGTWPLSYRWYLNGTNALSDGGQLSGAGSAMLTINNVGASNAGSYSVTVSNVFGSVASSNATLTILDLPTANSDSYGVAAGTTLTVAAPGVLGNDTDGSGSNLTATLVTGPTHGTLNLDTNGGFIYIPLTNYVGTDNFTYQAGNGQTNSGVATVTISITAGGVLFSDDFTRLADPDHCRHGWRNRVIGQWWEGFWRAGRMRCRATVTLILPTTGATIRSKRAFSSRPRTPGAEGSAAV